MASSDPGLVGDLEGYVAREVLDANGRPVTQIRPPSPCIVPQDEGKVYVGRQTRSVARAQAGETRPTVTTSLQGKRKRPDVTPRSGGVVLVPSGLQTSGQEVVEEEEEEDPENPCSRPGARQSQIPSKYVGMGHIIDPKRKKATWPYRSNQNPLSSSIFTPIGYALEKNWGMDFGGSLPPLSEIDREAKR